MADPLTRRVAARLEPKVRREFLAAIKQLESEIDIAALVTAVQSRSQDAVDLALKLSTLPKRFDKMVATIVTGFQRAGVLTAQELTAAGLSYAFDLTNPFAVSWARNYGGTLISEVAAQAPGSARILNVVRVAVGDGIEFGVPPVQTARLLRESVGLTPRMAKAVDNRFKQVVEKRWAVHGNIDRAMAEAGKSALAYKKKLINHRARLIARTETINASNAGQMQSWQQAADKNLLSRKRTRRKWVTGLDDLVCNICAPMHGQTVAFEGESFITGLGASVDMPTAHPACRCGMDLVFEGKG